jgi:tRNA A-37 threonylcarbamoyl transferase component Bud32
VKSGDKLAGRYEIRDLLGRGGMGEVWRATDQTLDRPVAVKTLSTRLSSEELQESLPRFQREGRAAARLNHPSIATIFDAGEHDGQLFMVLELVNGEDLARVLAREPGGLPVGQVLEIGTQAADGLAVAHEAGVIHRDIKPANLMLLRRGQVKILDFGIARLEGTASSLSATGAVLGTMAYMPPEQMLGQPISGSADVYSLGATLFHLLTGRVVFPGDDLRAVVAQHLTAQPPDPRAFRSDCPAELASYVLSMLAKEPGQRPDAEAVTDALHAMRSAAAASPAVPAAAVPAGPVTVVTGPAGPQAGPGIRSVPADGRSGPVAAWAWGDLRAISKQMVIPVNEADHGSPYTLAFSPDGRILASRGEVVQLWDVHSGGLLATYPDRERIAGVGGVSFSHRGDLLATSHQDADAIILRDVTSGRVVTSLIGMDLAKDQIVFSPDDALLAASTAGEVGVWDVATGRLIAAESVPVLGSIAFSPDGKILAIGAADRVLLRAVDQLWHGLRPRLPDLTVDVRNASNWGVSFSPDGQVIAAAVSGPRRASAVYLWSVPDARPLVRYASSKGIIGLAFSPAGDVIASVEDLRSVTLWEAGTGRPVTVIDSAATCLAFSPDGGYLAVGCTREIHLWRSGLRRARGAPLASTQADDATGSWRQPG